MSLLGQGSSSRNFILPDDDDFDGHLDLDSAQVLTDGFDDDADDDDLSLDGIYDGDDDQGVPPPIYEEPASTSAFSKVSDTKGGPVANTGPAFNAQTPNRSLPNFMFRRSVTPNSAPPDSPLVAPNSSLPYSPPVVASYLSHGAPGTHFNAPPRTYYPGVDVCIVCTLPLCSISNFKPALGVPS